MNHSLTFGTQGSVPVDLQTDALVVVDVQPTFMPGGGLPVQQGDLVVPIVRQLMERFPRSRRFATKDQHPRGHISLASSYVGLAPMTPLTEETVAPWTEAHHCLAPHARFTLAELKQYLSRVQAQVLWPDHAIAGTAEAELHPALSGSEFAFIQVKGVDPNCDSYSGFFDNLRRGTGLAEQLRRRGVQRCFFVGLAFDYCVGWSAEGAVAEGFPAVVVEDATRAVGFPPDSVEKMRASFREKNIAVVHSTDLQISPAQ